MEDRTDGNDVTKPRCVAQTEAFVLPPSAEYDGNNYFKSVQWSPDGTTLLTNSADNTLRSYVLPPDLLSSIDQDEGKPKPLAAYSSQAFSEPISSTAFYPHFNLSDLSTTLHLSTPRGLPITLSQSIYPDSSNRDEYPQTVATYPLIHRETDTPITPTTVVFHPLNPSVFLTASSHLLCAFDLSRPYEGPIYRHVTAPSAKKRKTSGLGGRGLDGIVSALATSVGSESPGSHNTVLAAGTLSRNVGLYDIGTSGASIGNAITVFSVADDAERRTRDDKGSGVISLVWSPDGCHLFVAERCSDLIQVYDVRMTNRRVGMLKGRNAVTNQRLGIEVVRSGEGQGGYAIWAGGVDGMVHIWENPAIRLGENVQEGLQPSYKFQAHDDAVASAVVHPSGTVAATCSGQRHRPRAHWDASSEDDESSQDDKPSAGGTAGVDNSLKVWTL